MPQGVSECVELEWRTEIEVKPPQTVTFVKRAELRANVEHALTIATGRGQLEELLSSVDVRFFVRENNEERETTEGSFSIGFDTDENYSALIQQCQEQLPDGSMKTLLSYLIGSKAKIVTRELDTVPSQTIEASVIGWEMRNVTANWVEGEPYVNVLEGSSLRSIPLSEIASVEPLEQAKLDTLTRALSLVHLGKTNKGAQVTILASTPRTGVTIECQYSLTLPSVSVTLHKLYLPPPGEEHRESVLQTFTVIKNPTHDNWENVSVRFRGASQYESSNNGQVITLHASQSALVPITGRMEVTSRVVGVWSLGTSYKALEFRNSTQYPLAAGFIQVFDSSRRMISGATTRIPRLNIGQQVTIPINELAVLTEKQVTRSYYTTPTAVSIKKGQLTVTRNLCLEHSVSMTSYEEEPIVMRVQYNKQGTSTFGIYPLDEVVAHVSPGETEVVAYECVAPYRVSIDLSMPQSVKALANFLHEDRAVSVYLPDLVVEELRKLTTLYERYWDALNSLKASTDAASVCSSHRSSLLQSMASVAGTHFAEQYAAQLLRIDDEIHRHSVAYQDHFSEKEKASSLISKLTRRLECSVTIPDSQEDADFQPQEPAGFSFGKGSTQHGFTFGTAGLEGVQTGAGGGAGANAEIEGTNRGFGCNLASVGGQGSLLNGLQPFGREGALGGGGMSGRSQQNDPFATAGGGKQNNPFATAGGGKSDDQPRGTTPGATGFGTSAAGQSSLPFGSVPFQQQQQQQQEQAAVGYPCSSFSAPLATASVNSASAQPFDMPTNPPLVGSTGQASASRFFFGEQQPAASSGTSGGTAAPPETSTAANATTSCFNWQAPVFGGPSATPFGGFTAPSKVQPAAANAPAYRFRSRFSFPAKPASCSNTSGKARTFSFAFGARPCQSRGGIVAPAQGLDDAQHIGGGKFSFGTPLSSMTPGPADAAPQVGFRMSCPTDPGTGERDDGSLPHQREDSSTPSAEEGFSFGGEGTSLASKTAERSLLDGTSPVEGPAPLEPFPSFGSALEEAERALGSASPSGAPTPFSVIRAHVSATSSTSGVPSVFSLTASGRRVDLGNLGLDKETSSPGASSFLDAVLQSGEGTSSLLPIPSSDDSTSDDSSQESSQDTFSPAARPAEQAPCIDDSNKGKAHNKAEENDSSAGGSSSHDDP